MKNLKQAMIPFAALAIGCFANQSAFALGAARPQETTASVAAPAAPSQELLQSIFNQSTQELEQVNSLMKQGNAGTAMLAAKKIVDRVSLINPKGNFNLPIPVSGILTQPDLSKSFDNLLDHQKNELAQAVTAYKGGYFLDLLNLYKRAKLLYVQAFYQQMKSQLMKVDIEMMKSSLIQVYTISIFVSDDRVSDTFLLFDSDIANPDQQYMFDRELIATAVSIPELGMDEAAFAKTIADDMSARLKDHIRGLKVPAPVLPKCSCACSYTSSDEIVHWDFLGIYINGPERCEKYKLIGLGNPIYTSVYGTSVNENYKKDRTYHTSEACKADLKLFQDQGKCQ